MQSALPKRFGDFQFDSRARQLRKRGHTIRLHGQPLEILGLLLERPGEVVLREELRAKLWPEDTFVDFEHSLNAAVNKLREALDDDANNPRFIETVPRRGYRFIAPVEGVLPASAPDSTNLDAPAANQEAIDLGVEKSAAEVPMPSGARPRRRTLWLVFAACAFLVALLVGFDAGGLRQRFFGRPDPGGIRSIAVLPLENLSHDPEQEYFADGMTEALITYIAKIGALRVTSRTSVMPYKGTKKPLSQIARELNVDVVVEGSDQRSGDRVRIDAQLIDARNDRNLWTESYQSDLSDVLELQGNVARAIAGEVRVQLTPEERAGLSATRSVKREAYEAYLHGLYSLNKRTPKDVRRGIEYFQKAIDIDPTYALAYAGLADGDILLEDQGELPPREAMPRARAATKKALELDDSLAQAHASLAAIEWTYEWDLTAAGKQFERTLSLDPNYATAREWYAVYLTEMGRFDEAIAQIQRAHELDPLSLIIEVNLGRCYYFARRYDEAIERLQRFEQREPDF